ncbi:response regulator [Pontibacter locisalis]|uniref:Response regulator n=1 Tax=Pontibacter locisalis TaxID=1719035 RepID=A0ABW5IJY2_9BACT
MIQKRVRVVIAEDHVVLRQWLRLLLEQDDEILIVGEAGNGLEVLEILSESPADVVLMDINMPVMNGYEATEEICASFPDTKVIGLSMHNSVPYVQKMLSCGASGYMLKTSNQDELFAAVKLVSGGSNYFCGELSKKLLEQSRRTDPNGAPLTAERKQLSKRELEVLSLIAEGYTNVEIANKLYTSKRTIETHRQNILEKTHAKNTANLIKYAIENNIIGIDDPEV